MRILFFLPFLLNLLSNSSALDSLKGPQYITDGQNLISANDTFQLGFFSTGASTNRFLGIWFNEAPQTVVWIANRDRPIYNSSGVLSISENGNLELTDTYMGNTVWFSNSTYTTNPTSVQLLESGNLVLRDLITNGILWQSFDWPTNTFLPGMKIGKNLKTGHEWSLASWLTSDNPENGKYHYTMDWQGSPEIVMWYGTTKRYRTGSWIGLRFSGIPEMSTYQDMFSFYFTNNSDEISFGYSSKPGALPSRVTLNESGVVQRLVWVQNISSWSTFWSGPRDQCDYYSKCGAFGVCNANAATICSCLQGFVPKSPINWYMRDNSQGCVRRVELGGDKAYGFYVVKGVKLPDTHSAIVETIINLDQCREKCLHNYSCVAYSAADTRNGGSGCIMWFDNLVDTRFIDGGQVLYIKVAQSEIGTFLYL
ncbi:hypothetical protein LUZ61_002344 [Rhynchospora tenuis]|uniref:non-specific serine/threonine protein kinase n=1 Tax=Rhynchospora tenuis TaxID=198213 RepID=A0AAD5ZJ70_9POAL|nr:hypothetical protein LUZ61_002344 [Rhynchospora tenuis]